MIDTGQMVEYEIERIFHPEQYKLKQIIVYLMNSDLVITVLSLMLSIALGAEKYLDFYSKINIINIVFVFVAFLWYNIKYPRKKPLSIIVFLFFTIVLVVSLVSLPEFSTSIINNIPIIVLFFTIAMPSLLFSAEINLWGDVLKISIPYTILSVVFSILVIVFSNKIDVGYNIISSALLVPTIAALICFLIEKKRWSIIVFLLNLLVLTFRGSRSPLIAIIGAIVIVFLCSLKRLTIKKILLYMFCLLLFILILFEWPHIIIKLRELFPDSRTIYLLSNISDKEVFDTGRGAIFSGAIALIQRNPISGYGFFRSTYLLSVELGYDGFQKGIYAHNFVLDFILHFGIIIGIGLLAIYFLQVTKCTIKASNNRGLIFITALLVGHIIQLMVTGTYIDDKLFWISIGFIISQNNGKFVNMLPRYKKRETNNNK